MRKALGDGYVDALHQAWPKVPESSDFVMHWWHRAAELLIAKKIEGFGLITTNSISQIFNRRIVQDALKSEKIYISYAVPDHPWVDSSDGAAVRIAITVCHPGQGKGILAEVLEARRHEADDYAVEFDENVGQIHSNLKIGANTSLAQSLNANKNLSSIGVKLYGPAFVIKSDQAKLLGRDDILGLDKYIKHYVDGQDITKRKRGLMVIDLDGLTSQEVLNKYPDVYHYIYTNVKPSRDLNKDKYRRENWWLFGRKNTLMRKSIKGLRRYIGTAETSKHRLFQFIDETILPGGMVVTHAL